MPSPSPSPSPSIPPKPSTSLFIRNLPPKTTKSDLDTHFSTIGPLRRSLIVTDSTTGLCKGIGFVHFALVEDAQRAKEALNGSFIKGRRITVDAARPRNRGTKDSDGGLIQREKPGKKIEKKVGGLKGGVGMRTVIVRRTDRAIVDEDLIREKLGGGKHVEIIGGGKEVRCLFDSWASAGKGASQIHGGELEAFVEALEGGKGTRLIVRNLPFKCKEAELWEKFGKFARVREVRLEKARTKKGEEREKGKEKKEEGIVECAGFGFVEYFLVADAKFAMQKMNGSKIGGRVVAVDMALGKSDYVKLTEADVAKTDDKKENDDGKQDDGDKSGEESDESGSDESESEGEAEKADIDVVVKRKEYGGSAQAIVKKPGQSTADEMERTVFVRNILFETSGTELWKAMSEEFGAVEQAVIVKDSVTQRPRGTAFVRFAKMEDAEKAVERCGAGDTTKFGVTGKKSGFSLQGRMLLVSKAVDRSKAQDLEKVRIGKGKDEDPRNLKLAWIGQIKSGSKEAKGLSEGELMRRGKSVKQKQEKLSRNPNAFVSNVRLSVRNIPKEFEDSILKQLFLVGVQKGKGQEGKDVKIEYCKIIRDAERNDRSKGYGFVEFERHDDALVALKTLNNNELAMEMLISAKPRVLKIDVDRARMLRKQWGDGRRLQVEFSVEDRRKVEIINRIKEKGKKMKEECRKRKVEEGEGGDGGEKRKRKRKKKNKEDEGDIAKVEMIPKSEKKAILNRKRGEEEDRKRVEAKAKEMQVEVESKGKRIVDEPEIKDAKPKKPKKKMKHKMTSKNRENEGKLQDLVVSYKRKLEKKIGKVQSVGASSSSHEGGGGGNDGSALNRWFE